MKELIKAEEEKTLFIGRHGNECIYVVRVLMDQSMLNTVCVPLMTAANVLLIGV